MNILNRLLAMRRDRRRRQRDAYIDSLFQIEERCGQMWLTCEGHAFLSFPEDAHSLDMLRAADNARATAKAYDKRVNVADFGDNDDPGPIILNVSNYDGQRQTLD